MSTFAILPFALSVIITAAWESPTTQFSGRGGDLNMRCANAICIFGF